MSSQGGIRARQCATIALCAGAIGYAGPILEALVGYPLDPAHSFLSELAARNQPFHVLFRSADAAAALAVLIGALCMARLARPRLNRVVGDPATGSFLQRIWARLRDDAWLRTAMPIALATFGVATVLDAALPMDCATSIAECRALERSGQVSLSHHLHAFTSSVAGAGIIAVCIIFLLLTIGRTISGDRRWRAWVIRLGQIVAGVVLALLVGQLFFMAVGIPLGWVQRVQVLATSVIFGCCAALLSPAHAHGQAALTRP